MQKRSDVISALCPHSRCFLPFSLLFRECLGRGFGLRLGHCTCSALHGLTRGILGTEPGPGPRADGLIRLGLRLRLRLRGLLRLRLAAVVLACVTSGRHELHHDGEDCLRISGLCREVDRALSTLQCNAMQ